MFENKRLYRITKIFRANGWFNTQRSEVAIHNALDRSIELSLILDIDQFDLFCVLLSKYIFFDIEQYIPSFERVLAKLTPNTDINHNYRLVPLLAPKDRNKVKSGNNQLYMFAHTVWNRSEKFRSLKILPYMNTEMLKKSPIQKGNFTTIVIDDFIGTGNTAKDFLKDYRTEINPMERIVFMALVAMQIGVHTIQELGCDVFVDKLAPRGIADCEILMGEAKYYSLMSAVEELVDISKEYHCGYGKS